MTSDSDQRFSLEIKLEIVARLLLKWLCIWINLIMDDKR